MKFFLMAFMAAVISSVLVVYLQSRRFHRLVTADVNTLFSDAAASVGPGDLKSRWKALPEPIRRHLRYAIPEYAPPIHTARLKHKGYFRTSPDQQWFAIEGEQYFTAKRPGFVWNARIRPAPFLWIEARDRLLSGKGNMFVKFLSTIRLANATGPEIDQGSNLRWLAEAAWFPYALVGDHVEWQSIDAQSARATLRTGNPAASAVFHVDDDGWLSQVRAERYRDIGGGKAILTPWVGRYFNYREFNGFRIPSSVEVSWQLENRLFTYARFQITTIQYNVPERF